MHKKYHRFLHGHENYTLVINMDTNYTQRVRLSDQISNLHDILTIVVGSENSNFNSGLVLNNFIKISKESSTHKVYTIILKFYIFIHAAGTVPLHNLVLLNIYFCKQIFSSMIYVVFKKVSLDILVTFIFLSENYCYIGNLH